MQCIFRGKIIAMVSSKPSPGGRDMKAADREHPLAMSASVCPGPRRSKRKILISPEDSPVLTTTKKARKSKASRHVLATYPVRPPPPTMMVLPLDVHKKFLQYLDVRSMEALASTCSYFYQMVHGRYITRLNIPFSGNFLAEMKKAQIIEKKSLLRLECKKLKMNDQHTFSKFADSGFQVQQYLLESQMDLLSLSRIRELDLVPDFMEAQVTSFSISMWECAKNFDHILLTQLSRLGVLNNISRLDIVLGMEDLSHDLWKEIIPDLTSLVELRLVVLERRAG